jgi:glycyl-tRNA synthetase beta chain
VLVTAMEKHQKFFPVVDEQDRLLPAFVGVANIDSKDPEALRAGHERVLRARLADARFFWDADRKRTLAERVDDLRHVVFQAKLGTLYDKAERLAVLAPVVAEAVDPSVAALAERAGWLAKADLLTEMVDEFDTLQGTMGRYYAELDGEDAQVAAALEEQYRPGSAADRLPQTATGAALAIADRMDTIAGCFGIGLEPTGSKDPFALRRAGIGLLRIAVERGVHLDVAALAERALAGYGDRLEREGGETVTAVVDFLLGRLAPMYAEDEHSPVRRDVMAEAGRVAREHGTGEPPVPGAETVDAILSLRPTDPFDAHLRLKGLMALLAHPDAEVLIGANKRIANILRKAEDAVPDTYDQTAFTEAAERELAEAFAAVEPRARQAAEGGRYAESLLALAELRPAVDRFFDHVMVMAEDAGVRRNRLALLATLHRAFCAVADLARLPG